MVFKGIYHIEINGRKPSSYITTCAFCDIKESEPKLYSDKKV